MDNKKNRIMTLAGIIVLLITVIGLTYAFFAPQAGGTTSTNAVVTSNTTDSLSFSISNDISFTVSPAQFSRNGENQSGNATVTAVLTPNNKTGTANMNYNLVLVLKNNPIKYSTKNINHDPELMLQVFDDNNNLVTLSELGTQKTVKGITGYDITDTRGLKTILDNHQIIASNNTTKIENWRVVITLINLDVGQNDNTGKTVTGELIIVKDIAEIGFIGYIYRNNNIQAYNGDSIIPVTGMQWVMTDGTEDYLNFGDQATCNARLIELNAPNTIYCEEKSGTFGGVGWYTNNANTIRTATYDVYCPIGGNNQICTDNWYYSTEDNCLDDVDTNTFTCTAGTITKPYYLKHFVYNNKVEDTEVCLWYNNNEVCLTKDYWKGNSQDQIDGGATKLKLKTALESALHITLTDNECDSDSYYAGCWFDNYYCEAVSDGSVYCEYKNGNCNIESNGLSKCN